MKFNTVLSFLALLAVTGCTMYHPLPLEHKVTLAPSVSHLKVDTHDLAYGHLRAHRFDPADGLDMTEVAMLAVANNPGLKLARDQAQLENAQAFKAGLLPDPQFSYSRVPTQGTQGMTSGSSASLGFEFSSLLGYFPAQSAERYKHRQTDLDILWQEWQVIAQARLLFSRAVTQHRLLAWLTARQELAADRYRKVRAAFEQGNLTGTELAAALTAWQAAGKQATNLQRQALQTHKALNALLGLAPKIQLKLVQDDAPPLPDEKAMDRMAKALSSRRPDLLALKWGYQAQDEYYRRAILNQFPALGLSLVQANEGGLVTHGLSLSLSLPLFNRNRGNVAVQGATRKQLHDEYQFRLNSAYAEVHRLMADSKVIEARLQIAQSGMRTLDARADGASRALAQGLIDETGYVQFQGQRIAKHVEVIGLEQSLLEDRIALLTLLGGDMDEWNAKHAK